MVVGRIANTKSGGRNPEEEQKGLISPKESTFQSSHVGVIRCFVSHLSTDLSNEMRVVVIRDRSHFLMLYAHTNIRMNEIIH